MGAMHLQAGTPGDRAPDEVPAEREWLTIHEAATYLGTSRRALLMAISRGRLAPDAWGARGRGRCHRFRRETLDAYITGNEPCQSA